MKKLFLVLAMLVAMNVNAQWVQQYTGTTANLYDIEFLNRYTGWSVGAAGTCLKTTNGGINWIQMNHPVGTKPLNSVHIVDSNVVYFVGYFETIFKTTNGGLNWVIIRNGPSGGGNSYFGLYFLNKDSGWVCGNGNKVLRTRNGGITFDSGYVSSNWLYDMHFKDANTGFVTTQGAVFKTTNGGSTWFYSLYLTDTRIFWKISFVENTFGWVAAYNENGIHRTTNFGVSWDLVSTYVSGMFGVCFVNKDTGFIGGLTNWLFKTTDGGYNWARENTSTNNNTFESIEFVNDTIGWTCSTGGVIMHTTTGGQTLVTVKNISTEIPSKYSLSQNYPNPFNPTTNIKFSIVNAGEVKLVVYDIQGREVRTLVNESLKPGTYEAAFDGSALNSGVYFYKLSTSTFSETKKMLLIK